MIDEPMTSESPDPYGETMAPPHPPPPPPIPHERRLVRDPFSRLGGVASGVAHYYGLDVSLVRILFVLFAFMTGFGFLVYLVAWLVIPRATYWPPPGGPTRSLRSLSGRDLGLGLAVVGLMFAVGVGSSGVAGTVLIPLLLVGGGVWLLVQSPAPTSASVEPGVGDDPGLGDAAATANIGAEDTLAPGHDAGGSGGSGGYTGVYGSPGPAGAPVPPPSARRRWGIVAIVGAVVLAVLAIPVLIVGAVIVGVVDGDIDFNTDPVLLTPATAAAIPESIVRDAGEIVVDLSSLDAADFEALDEPVSLDVQLDLGSIRVIVPDDIEVAVDANADVGSVSIFGDSDDGFDTGMEVSPSSGSADVDLELEVDLGEIKVERP